jgi:2-oxo-3-hexenedioate decarboxylase
MYPETDVGAIARELWLVYRGKGAPVEPPSARFAKWNLDLAYAVEAEFAKIRFAEEGHRAVGRKVGYASTAAWRLLKLDTLAWARMYDDTVHYSATGLPEPDNVLALGAWRNPKIEPEVVFKLKCQIQGGEGAAAVLVCTEWLALGFELVDDPYSARFTPPDFVAAYGLHRGLFVGPPLAVDAASIPALVEALPKFKLRLFKNGELAEEGWGKNSLRSPALCVAELAAATRKQPGAEPLGPDELISTGSLIQHGQPIATGQTWSAEVEGLPLAKLTLRIA